jgi:energy-coupling factor transporter ATP-binding protein EcfA2
MVIQKPAASISQLTFSGGNIFDLKPTEKIILVGPNNSGKSQTLREILSICKDGKKGRTVVVDLKLAKSGSADDLKRFLEMEAAFVNDQYRYKSWQFPASHIHVWSGEFLLHGLSPGFIKSIGANDRLTICDQQASISPDQPKSKPQHILYDDEKLMSRISGLFRHAFGRDLMFDFRGGSQLPIHVGEIPCGEGLTDRAGDAYVCAVRQNPRLDQQGDGIKSYAGILFEAVVADLDITLIDEPEAFLHPPQMRRLGETLSNEVKGQLIVATHSSDILRGFLEGTRGDVRILRIIREADQNVVAEASQEIIKELWEKPELRYSNALEGIFHEQTIICEHDGDCKVMNAVADYLADKSEERWRDTAYVPTGGKYGFPKVADVLRQVGVPVKAVFDMDFLSEREFVRKSVKAFGGKWNDIEPFWTRVDAAVRGGIKPKCISEIKAEITELLEKSKADELPKGDIREALKQGTAWSEVKRFGVRAIPKGDAQGDFYALRDKLEEIGIFLVPVGEIEDFCPQIGLHGPKFVTKLLSTVPLSDDSLAELRAFVERVHKGPHSK